MSFMKVVVGSIAALTLAGPAFAIGGYFPPERINCHLDEMNKLACVDFNRQVLVEDVHAADFPKNKNVVFSFSSGVAYFTPEKNDWQIFFTYKNANHQFVKLKTTRYSIQPDLKKGAWVKYKDEFYNCTAGYMSCLISI